MAGYNPQIWTVTLADAVIKTLPTTPVSLVAAPGANKMTIFFGAFLDLNSTAGLYTNLVNESSMAICYGAPAGGYDISMYTVDDTTGPVTLDRLTTFFGAAGRKALWLTPAAGSNEEWGAQPFRAGDTTALINAALNLYIDNVAGGDYTGGNGANTLKVYVYGTVLGIV